MDRYHVDVTLTEAMLGTVTKDPEIYKSYIATKTADIRAPAEVVARQPAIYTLDAEGQAALTAAALADETATVQKIEEKGWTGFHTFPDGAPFIYDYLIKGNFKAACGFLRRIEGMESANSKFRAYKQLIDGLVFVTPRKIKLKLPEGVNPAALPVLERPLRASTPQGERIALARSDLAPAGTKLQYEIEVLGVVTEALLREWLDYAGKRHGLGQWRGGGWGTFEYVMRRVG